MRLTRRKAIVVLVLAVVAAGFGLEAWELKCRAPLPRHLRDRMPGYWRTVFIGPADVREAVRGLYARSREDRTAAAGKLGDLGPRAESAAPWLLAMLVDGEVLRDGTPGPLMVPDGAPPPPPQEEPPPPPTLSERILAIFVGRQAEDNPPDDQGGGLFSRTSQVRPSNAASDALASIGPAVVPLLIEALHDPIPEVRLSAAQALGNSADPRAIEPLRLALDDPHGEIRNMAAQALGAFSDPRAVEILSAICADSCRGELVRLNVAAALDDLGRAARAPVLQLLRSPAVHDRRMAISAMTRKESVYGEAYVETARWTSVDIQEKPPDSDLFEALLAASADSDEVTASLAIEAVRRYRHPRVTETLLAALQSSSPAVRTHAANGLAALKEPRAVEPLLGILAAEGVGPGECQTAAEVLVKIGSPRAVPGLLAALKDLRPFVCTEAALALGQLHETGAADAIAALLADDTPSGTDHDPTYRGAIRMGFDKTLPVKVFAAMALADLGDGRGAPVLARALAVPSMQTPEDTDLCKSIMKVAPAAVAPLLELTGDAKGGYAACRTLAEISDPRAAAALAAAAADKACPGRRAAVAALGRSGGQKQIELLAALAQEPEVRLPALVAMAQLRDKRALAPLLEALDSCTQEEAVGILDALGDLGDPQAVEPIIALELRHRGVEWPRSPSDPAHFVRERYWHYFDTVVASAVLRLGDPRGVGMMLDSYAVYDDELANMGPTPSIIWGFGHGTEFLSAPGQAAYEPLLAALADKRKGVLWEAAHALVDVRGLRALGPLRVAYASADRDGREAILDAVANVTPAAAADFLSEVAADPDPEMRIRVLWVLARCDTPAAVEAIRRATRDPCLSVRFAAWDWLKTLTGERPPAGAPQHRVYRGGGAASFGSL